MKKVYFLVEFPVFTHTRSIHDSTYSITAEVMVESDQEWNDRDLEKAVAEIADPWLYKLSGGYGYGTGEVKSHLRANEEPAYAATSEKYPGVFVGAVYQTQK